MGFLRRNLALAPRHTEEVAYKQRYIKSRDLNILFIIDIFSHYDRRSQSVADRFCCEIDDNHKTILSDYLSWSR